MTIEELKRKEDLKSVSVYPAKDSEGNRKYDSDGNPLYKFVGEKIDLTEKPLFGYVSKNLGKKIESGEPYQCTVNQADIQGNLVYMIVESSALATW